LFRAMAAFRLEQAAQVIKVEGRTFDTTTHISV